MQLMALCRGLGKNGPHSVGRLQVNPDLPDLPDAWLYRVWDSSWEDHTEEHEASHEVEMSGDLENDSLDTFMHSIGSPDTAFCNLETDTPKLPDNYKLPTCGKPSTAAAAKGKPPKPSAPKPKAPPADQRKKDIDRLKKTLGDAMVEVGPHPRPFCLVLTPRWARPRHPHNETAHTAFSSRFLHVLIRQPRSFWRSAWVSV